MEPFPHIKRIAIIGAGPAGLATAKYLLAEKTFTKITIFEQRPEVGGVWNYSGDPSKSNRFDFTIPRIRPSKTVERPVFETSRHGDDPFHFPSPLYDLLETNIPHTLMNFSDKPFPTDCSLFPKFEVVKKYLDEYSSDVKHLLKLGTQTVKVSPALENGANVWDIISEEVATSTKQKQTFDAVICASGHYSDPYIPDIAGLPEFYKQHPDIVSHSKYYRRPAAYAGKKVLIIGNSASGIDISAQISQETPHVIVSEKTKPTSLHNASTTITYHPEVASFLSEQRGVRFTNGHVESDVDSVIFCTGYQYSFPFLEGLDPAPVTTGERTNHVYEHIFYHPRPTLSFLTLPQRIVPFPVAEAQGAYIARVYSGRLSLPTAAEMEAWESAVVAEKGPGKMFHNLAFPADAEYINRLYEKSMTAIIERDRCLDNQGKGKIPPYWGEEKQWTRQRFPLIKQAAQAWGDRRHEVRSLKDLGFDFATWKKEQL